VPDSPDRPFEIGLVMTGAVTAGAYNAGGVDFRVQSLDTWEEVRAKRFPACPPYEVQLKVFANFLDREFRAHDYHLGWFNCRRFLRRHVVLPERLDGADNPLFARWPEPVRAAHRVCRELAGEQNVFLSTQVLTFAPALKPDPALQRKNEPILRGMSQVINWAKKHKVRVCIGTDLLLDPRLLAQQSNELVACLQWFKPEQILQQATGVNGELLKLSGKQNSYDPDGPIKIGVGEPGAFADLLLVDGAPVANLKLLTDPGKNLLVITKDGAFHRKVLPAAAPPR
jgi:hypothetical protein